MGLPLQALIDVIRNAAEAAFVDGDEKAKLKRLVERKLEAVAQAARDGKFWREPRRG